MALNGESDKWEKPYLMNQGHAHKSHQHYNILGDGVPVELLTELQGNWYYRVLGNWSFCGVWQPALYRPV